MGGRRGQAPPNYYYGACAVSGLNFDRVFVCLVCSIKGRFYPSVWEGIDSFLAQNRKIEAYD